MVKLIRVWFKFMNKNQYSKNGFIHLYNPEEEGLGLYDIHYMNAYKKDNRFKDEARNKNKERYAA